MRSSRRLVVLSLALGLAGIGSGCGTLSPDEPLEFPDVGQGLSAQVRESLEDPSELEIYALHPYPHEQQGAPRSSNEDFHGFRILDRAELDLDADRHALVTLVYRGIIESDGRGASCFTPRHGIRAHAAGGTIDLVISYPCLSLQAFEGQVHLQNVFTAEGVAAAVTQLYERLGVHVHP